MDPSFPATCLFRHLEFLKDRMSLSLSPSHFDLNMVELARSNLEEGDGMACTSIPVRADIELVLQGTGSGFGVQGLGFRI